MIFAGSLALVAVAYYLTGRIGLELAYLDGAVAALWPPAGLGLAVLFLPRPQRPGHRCGIRGGRRAPRGLQDGPRAGRRRLHGLLAAAAPSSITYGTPTLVLPTREAQDATLTGAP